MKKKMMSLIALISLLLPLIIPYTASASEQSREVIVGTSGQTKPLNYFDENNDKNTYL